MIFYRYVLHDNVFGIEHKFEFATDATPWHRHEEEHGHAVQLVSGKARLEFEFPYGHSLRRLTSVELNFDGTRVHRLVADRGGTIVFNRLYPTPSDWRARLKQEGEWRCL